MFTRKFEISENSLIRIGYHESNLYAAIKHITPNSYIFNVYTEKVELVENLTNFHRIDGNIPTIASAGKFGITEHYNGEYYVHKIIDDQQPNFICKPVYTNYGAFGYETGVTQEEYDPTGFRRSPSNKIISTLALNNETIERNPCCCLYTQKMIPHPDIPHRYLAVKEAQFSEDFILYSSHNNETLFLLKSFNGAEISLAKDKIAIAKDKLLLLYDEEWNLIQSFDLPHTAKKIALSEQAEKIAFANEDFITEIDI